MYNNAIYIVNDSPTITEAIVELLKSKGFENISTFKDGRELLKGLETNTPELLISDIHMPAIDGFQLCRILRSDEFREHNKLPVILISATYRDAIAEKIAYESGANAFLQFPPDPDELTNLIFTNLLIDLSAKKMSYKRKALVADDDTNILNALKFFIEEEGYNVITADDGEEAIDAFKREKPQITFLDYKMPKKDGIEVMKWIRENQPETGIIMMSAFGTELKTVDIIEAGADDYIKKPFDIKSIHEICDKAFNRYNIRLIDRQFKEKVMEREMMIEQLRQAEKLSSIGTLVSSITHELGNPLLGIIVHSELLMSNIKLSDEIKGDLKKIHKEANRCATIAKNLLSFARKYKIEKKPVNINEILQSIIILIEYQLKINKIQLIIDLDDNIPVISGDTHHIQQVFLNIITNAYQAMNEHGKGGLLTIKTEGFDDKSISISFKNNGPPIPDEHLHKIFEPFFTTKGVDKGTGLGLSIAYGIIKDHGGSISAGNIEDGVVFKIALPVNVSQTQGKKPLQQSIEKSLG